MSSTNAISIQNTVKVKGSYTVLPKRYHDNRGYFQELYNKDTYPSHKYKQISISNSAKNVLRGLHCSPYGKFVQCVSGCVYDGFIDLRADSPTFLQWFGATLSESNQKQLYIPPRCGHGFFSVEDNSKLLYMQEGTYTPGQDIEINPLDPKINISWPKPMGEGAQYIISEKDQKSPMLYEVLPVIRNLSATEHWGAPVEYVVIGSTGFFGSTIINVLKSSGRSYACMPRSVRMQHRNDMEYWLDLWKPKYVINCAGTTGNPNIDWCEGHAQDTVDINVTGQLNVAHICFQRGIHCTLFGTGCLYSFREDRKRPVIETDEPDFKNNVYGRLRAQLESLVKHYPKTVLSLRVAFPIDGKMHPKSLVAKLVKYNSITCIPTSYTVMDSLFPLIPKMIEAGATGIYNFTNPGKTDNGEILDMYGRVFNVPHSWKLKTPSQEHVKDRAYSELDVSKLEKIVGKIPQVQSAILSAFRSSKKMERSSLLFCDSS